MATVGVACFLRVAATHDHLPLNRKAGWKTNKQSCGFGET